MAEEGKSGETLSYPKPGPRAGPWALSSAFLSELSDPPSALKSPRFF